MSHRTDAGAETRQTHTGYGAGPAFLREWDDVGSCSWPLRSHLELAAFLSAVPCARLHAQLVVTEWGLGVLADTVELVVSELVTNGIQASEELRGSWFDGQWAPGRPPVRLWLSSDGQSVLVRVWDSNEGRMPEVQHQELDAENGRGLFIVASLSEDYGAYLLERSSGKIVWAMVSAAGQLHNISEGVCR